MIHALEILIILHLTNLNNILKIKMWKCQVDKYILKKKKKKLKLEFLLYDLLFDQHTRTPVSVIVFYDFLQMSVISFNNLYN